MDITNEVFLTQEENASSLGEHQDEKEKDDVNKKGIFSSFPLFATFPKAT